MFTAEPPSSYQASRHGERHLDITDDVTEVPFHFQEVPLEFQAITLSMTPPQKNNQLGPQFKKKKSMKQWKESRNVLTPRKTTHNSPLTA